MTPRQLAEWIMTLPEDVQNGNVGAWLNSASAWPANAKRVVAYRWKDNSGAGITINTVGVHIPMSFYDGDAIRIESLTGGGEIDKPQ